MAGEARLRMREEDNTSQYPNDILNAFSLQ